MRLVVGLGLTSAATPDDVRSAIDEALAQVASGWNDVAIVATTRRRRSHPALADLGEGTEIRVAFFEPSDLAEVTVPNPSDAIGERAGTTSVAEAAALLAARVGVLLLPKQVSNGTTVALAELPTYGSSDPE